MKFRKKSVIVEATQWFLGKEVPGIKVAKAFFYSGPGGTDLPEGTPYVVTIHKQPTVVAPGDWIITEPDGIHHYPCKPDIFEETYERVTDSQ